MKTNVIILAGGIGKRMGTKQPKQFLKVNRIPIIVRTINNFQHNDRINNITIVCVKEYIHKLQKLVEEYHLTKVNNIVSGGQTGHDSTRNGVFSLKDKLSDNDFVIIHDAVSIILLSVN